MAPRLPAGAGGAWLRLASDDRAAAFCAAAGLPVLWALGHSFTGIEGDAQIYMGRALADADPGGVGRDPMFVLDGQSSFTLFRPLAGLLAATLGLGPTVAVLSIAALLAWFAGAAALARAVAPGRAALLLLAAVCVLPRVYTSWNLLSAGESLPVPRPLAEAGVLFALAALCRGRHVRCALWLGAASLFHPIMAAPGFGVLLLALGGRDRRWFVAGAALALVVLAGAAGGLPVLARLLAPVDPAWAGLLRERNPYLFLELWPGDGAGAAVVQGVTVLVGSRPLPPRVRGVFTASLVVAAGGCLASLLLGDWWGSQLVLQAQLWRALWLPAVLAPVAAGLCLRDLPGRGPAGRIALALLSLAWLAIDAVPLAPVAALAAAVALAGVPRLSFVVGRPTVLAAWAACLGLAALSQWSALSVLRATLAEMPPVIHAAGNLAWRLRLPVLPLLALAYAVWRRPGHPAARAAIPAAVAAGLAVLCFGWDIRTPARADADAAHAAPELAALLAPHPGPVLWTDGEDGWYWAHRANWIGQPHGAALVFSRDLAMLWRARVEAVMAAGLGTAWLLRPWAEPTPADGLRLDPARVAAFCRRADAPAAVVAALDPGAEPPPALAAAVWRPRLAHWKLVVGAATVRWRHLDRYAVIPCAGRFPLTAAAAAPAR